VIVVELGPAVEAAVEAAEQLKEELEAEVGRSREERVVLRSLDGVRIHQRISDRLAFIDRAEYLQRRLRSAQEEAARRLGIDDGSAESIARAAPLPGRRLLSVVGQIQALASTLNELTALNRTLAERALGYTRAYVQALAPRPTAYGRFGAPPPDLALVPVAAVSRRA
jgi:hypothetical protein